MLIKFVTKGINKTSNPKLPNKNLRYQAIER